MNDRECSVNECKEERGEAVNEKEEGMEFKRILKNDVFDVRLHLFKINNICCFVIAELFCDKNININKSSIFHFMLVDIISGFK